MLKSFHGSKFRMKQVRRGVGLEEPIKQNYQQLMRVQYRVLRDDGLVQRIHVDYFSYILFRQKMEATVPRTLKVIVGKPVSLSLGSLGISPHKVGVNAGLGSRSSGVKIANVARWQYSRSTEKWATTTQAD